MSPVSIPNPRVSSANNGTSDLLGHGDIHGIFSTFLSQHHLLESNTSRQPPHLRSPSPGPSRRPPIRKQRHHLSPPNDPGFRALPGNYMHQLRLPRVETSTQLHSTARAATNPENRRSSRLLQSLQLPGTMLVQNLSVHPTPLRSLRILRHRRLVLPHPRMGLPRRHRPGEIL
jgi:hypothetical protein